MDNSQSNTLLHYKYWLLILGLLLILVATDRWTGQENFTDYLTNIATMVSLVLGLVAIFYSFTSNSSLSQSLGNISTVSKDVLESKDEIAKFLAHAIDLEKSGADNAQALKEVSDSVEQNIASLKSALESVTEKTQLIHDSLGTLPGKFDQLESLIAEADSSKKQANNGGREAISDQSAIEFMKGSSLNGLVLLYSVVLAYSNGKSFSLDEYSSKASLNIDYAYGYFIAMGAYGLIARTAVKEQVKTFAITSIHPKLISNAREILVEMLERDYKKNKGDTYSRYLNKMQLLEAMYK